MDREQRIQKWLDEPDCDRKMAEACVALDDATEALHELDLLAHTIERTEHVQLLTRGMQRLAEVVRLEAGMTEKNVDAP